MPPASSVDSVRVKREMASTRITRPKTGIRSFSASKRSRPRSVRSRARSAMAKTKPAASSAHHQLRTNPEPEMIACVYHGSGMSMLTSSCVICGSTTVTSAITTSTAKPIIIAG